MSNAGDVYNGDDQDVEALELFGERWNLLIIRSIMSGTHRFTDLRRELGISSNMLQDRLSRLVIAGVLERHAYQDRPPRSEYRMTDLGAAVGPIITAIENWGKLASSS